MKETAGVFWPAEYIWGFTITDEVNARSLIFPAKLPRDTMQEIKLVGDLWLWTTTANADGCEAFRRNGERGSVCAPPEPFSLERTNRGKLHAHTACKQITRTSDKLKSSFQTLVRIYSKIYFIIHLSATVDWLLFFFIIYTAVTKRFVVVYFVLSYYLIRRFYFVLCWYKKILKLL